jgi:CDP-4-dehydro-6-deoxyglucose reductase
MKNTKLVTLSPSGHSFEVPSDQRILATGLEAGISMPYACRIGMCRTCRGKVLEGKVDFGAHLPQYLTEEDKAKGYALLCVANPLTDLVIELAELPLLEKPREYECIVKRIRKPTPDVAIVDLRLPLHEPMRFASGQYIDILLDGGERRSYSIANASAVTGLIDVQLHIKHVEGGRFTDQVFESLEERQRLRFSGPHGTFFLREDRDAPIIFVAAGTGYAPIRSILARALADHDPRPMKLYWGARSKRDLYLLDEARRWAEAHPHFELIPVLSAPTDLDAWTGRTGYVHHAVLEDTPDLSSHQVYAAGSPRMVDAARDEFIRAGLLPPTRFFADAFVDASYAVPVITKSKESAHVAC